MRPSFRCLVSTVESDAHIWNLIYLQKLLEEHDAEVQNLGCCTPPGNVVEAVSEYRPDLVVVSSINGHGHHGARVLIESLQAADLDVPCVIGGQLTTSEADRDRVRADLLSRGYLEVFTGERPIECFREFLALGASGSPSSWRQARPDLRPMAQAVRAGGVS
jgi:methylmalonyl-CoA mutase cobalamin-binding subunit